MADNSQDKTEKPTPRKLQEARRKGQVAKSKDLSAAIVLMAAVVVFLITSGQGISSLERQLTWYFTNCFSLGMPDNQLYWVLLYNGLQILPIFAPLFILTIIMAVAANVAQSGFLLSGDALKPKAERINPLEGFKRIFSRNSLFELVKSILKVVVVGVVSYLAAVSYIPEMLTMFYRNPGREINEIMGIITAVAAAGGGAYLILAVADFYYQKYDFLKRMRMTRQEVKDEYKQTEGDPQIKGWLRRRQREVALNRIRQEVPGATVVVTNPIHYAVALKYEEGVTNAPLVVAKGAGDIAFRLKEIARSSKVPVIQNPPLARALFMQVDVGREIPVELYQSAAEVLAMVMKIKANAG